MIDPTGLRSALHADWRSDAHTASSRQWWQRSADMQDSKCASLWGWEWHRACAGRSTWVMDTSISSISLPTNQPCEILHLQMQNTPITDAVMKRCFNLACRWLERKQPIHLTNEVISAIGWPCRFTHGHYTVREALSELCWPCHEGGRKSEWVRWIWNPSNPNLAWPSLKSVWRRHTIDRKEDLFAKLCQLAECCIKLNSVFDLLVTGGLNHL